MYEKKDYRTDEKRFCASFTFQNKQCKWTLAQQRSIDVIWILSLRFEILVKTK